MLFFLAALLSESWLLLLLLGLLPWPSCRPDRLVERAAKDETRPRWTDGHTEATKTVLPSDVSDVFVAGGVAGVPVQAHGARRVGRGRLAVDRGLVVLSGLQGVDRGTVRPSE